jgi:hypothetical protein
MIPVTELRLSIDRRQFDKIKGGKLQTLSLPPEIMNTLVAPYDFERVTLAYRTRKLFRDFEGIDSNGLLHLGDRWGYLGND